MTDKKSNIKIGIPRALLYHKYHIFWNKFFQKIGCETIISPETNQDILNKGINLAIDESCLSLKIFLGHVDYLKDKVDYILIPHIISPRWKEKTCVKLMSLYDIANNTFDNINIVEYTIDIDKLKTQFLAYFKLGLKFTKNPLTIIKAYFSAQKAQNQHKKELTKAQLKKFNIKSPERPVILIVSHPYTTYDGFLGKPITRFLESQNVDLLFSDVTAKRKLSKNISTDLYWTFNKELLSAVELYKNQIDGIIFLMTFPCGPDSLVVNLCQNKLKIPMTVLILDELQSETGLKTRLESFVDILKMKKSYA